MKEEVVLTKKEFLSDLSYHQYGRGMNGIKAIFFDWQYSPKSEDYYTGYKYCIYARTECATKKILQDKLYDFIIGRIEDVEEYYIQLTVAQTNQQRFKPPISSGGLNGLLRQNVRK